MSNEQRAKVVINKKKMGRYNIFFVLLVLLLGACGGNRQTVEMPSTPVVPIATPVPLPSPTPTLPPGKVILVTAPGYDSAEFQGAVAELAEGTGLTLTVLNSISPAEITPDVKIVVLLAPVQNLPELLVSAPQVQFAVLSPFDLTPAPNLSVVRLQIEKMNFVAGFLSTIIAYDYRSAALLPVEEPLGALAEDAFRSGAGYYCGNCSSVGAPVLRFPLIARVSSTADAATWQPIVESLRINLVYVMYVSPESANPEMLNNLAAQGYILVGGETPPAEVFPRWAATVRLDAASSIFDLWRGLMIGEGGKVVKPVITLADINRQFLSEGRQRLVDDLIVNLNKDAVLPLSVPWQ